jgi:DNA-binding MarR family transcriptional regulator
MKGAREKSGVLAAAEAVAVQGRTRHAPRAGSRQPVELDPLIHERTRLTILTALVTAPEGRLSFPDLRDALHLTDGNLTTHLRTLDDAGMVDLKKTGAGRGSSTTVELTASGRKAFEAYLARLESLIQAARTGTAERPPRMTS